MKKIMILGASRTQIPLINAAKKMGIYTIVAGIKGNYPGIDLADETCFIDINNKYLVLKKAKELKIDGIATCCMDVGIESLGYVCEKLNLIGISEKAGIYSNNKFLMKEVLLKNNVKTPKFYKIKSKFELEKAWNYFGKNKVVLKATDLQASRGVYVCDSWKQLLLAYKEISEISLKNICIMEEYINGIDIGAQAFIYRGKIMFLLPHNDEVLFNETNKPIGHSMPANLSSNILMKLKEEAIKAIRAIGLDNCAVNLDFIKTDKEIYVIELTGRAGATSLPELVSNYYGINYYELIVSVAMGEEPKKFFDIKKKNIATACRYIISNKSGIVTNIINKNILDKKISVDLFIDKGDYIYKFRDGRDFIGRIIVKGNTLEECYNLLDNAYKNILIEV